MLHVWYIYLHLPPKLPSFVGRCSSTMVRIWECFPHDFPMIPMVAQASLDALHGTLSCLDSVSAGKMLLSREPRQSLTVDGWILGVTRRLFVAISVTFDGVGSTEFFEVMLVE